MLFTRKFKDGIRAGRITRTYRRWKRPHARVGGRYNLAPDGIIEVTRMSRVIPESISDADAVAAGHPDAEALRAMLKDPADPVYLIEFRYLGSGMTGQPERNRVKPGELETLWKKLDSMDARSERAWTRGVLRKIAEQPGRRAGDLAGTFGWDTPTFKRQVRKLKALGLTTSLETGYELSPRGRQVLGTKR
jgi:hypothetical protein